MEKDTNLKLKIEKLQKFIHVDSYIEQHLSIMHDLSQSTAYKYRAFGKEMGYKFANIICVYNKYRDIDKIVEHTRYSKEDVIKILEKCKKCGMLQEEENPSMSNSTIKNDS